MSSTAPPIFKVSAKLRIVELYEEAACDLLAQHPDCLTGENPDRDIIAAGLLEAVLAGQRERRILRQYLSRLGSLP